MQGGLTVDGSRSGPRTYTVGQAARLGGVTIRTLHHYESIGLLMPSDRSSTGYRLYSESDLDRLTRILYYRELGFALEEIAALLGDHVDVAEHLERQHKLLTGRLRRLQAMVAAIEKEMETEMTGNELTPEEKLEIFGADYDPGWETEAEQRWGSTDAWRQSRARTKKFTKDDWRRVKAEGDAFNTDLVAAFRSGAAPDSEPALALAARHRGMIAQY